MKLTSAPPEIQRQKPKGSFVQTERKMHEAWAQLGRRNPTASNLLHELVSKVGPHNAVAISQTTLAKLLGVTDRTIRTALTTLESERWIQIVRLGKGRECAYVINDRVAWAQSRDNLRSSLFSATIMADADDQSPETLDVVPLQELPQLFADQRQLPSGPGLPPISQPALSSMELDLPATHQACNHKTDEIEE